MKLDLVYLEFFRGLFIILRFLKIELEHDESSHNNNLVFNKKLPYLRFLEKIPCEVFIVVVDIVEHLVVVEVVVSKQSVVHLLLEILLIMSTSDSGTSSTSSTSSRFSLASQIKEQVISRIVQLRRSKPLNSWRALILTNIVEIYFYYCVLLLPTIRDYPWGTIGNYVFLVLNFPSTLLLHWLSYSQSLIASIVIMSMVGLSLVLLTFTLFIYSTSSRKWRSKVRQLLFAFMYLCKMFHIVMLFVWVGYFDCSLVSVLPYSTTKVLHRFKTPQIACLDSTNTTMIGLVIFFICTLYVLIVIAEVVTFDTHALSNRNLFSNSSLTFPIFIRTMAFVSVIQMFAIPQSYAFISAITNMLISMASIALLFRTLPFNKRWMNSVFFGWAWGQCGASIGSLVTSLSNSGNEQELGIGLAILTVALIIIGVVFGVLSMELYTRWLLNDLIKRIAKQALSIDGVEEALSNTNETKILPRHALTEAVFCIYQQMSKNQNFKALCLLFKCSLQDFQKELIVDHVR